MHINEIQCHVLVQGATINGLVRVVAKAERCEKRMCEIERNGKKKRPVQRSSTKAANNIINNTTRAHKPFQMIWLDFFFIFFVE